MTAAAGVAALTLVGGSNSRDEDNFVRITDLLGTGLVPAQTRAALYEALALIPGTISTPGTQIPGGATGVSISRSEPTRDNETFEIIIDPNTGAYLGERSITRDGEVMSSAYFTQAIVDSTP